ncbi:MAG: hypothetical protein NAG76_02125 [Candidatus Pristimantibacillus lignocellulolyticus]|uniref:Adenosine deaminase domain-containing protein n=1 Tax=Candidatus Pristimantibacillus lignocellulolyticus TaxID=2994561 RepID=A0A9J6ZFZ9_9BACL|nr:MAG: hypothetical protein NAG76_02125 [Candidatus Pristimantibacillus lignocellulolyticus]
MNNKIIMMIQIAFFPLKDVTFYDDTILIETVKKIKNNHENIDNINRAIRTKVYQFILSRNNKVSLDEIDLYLEKYHPYLFGRDIPQHLSSDVEFRYFLHKHFFTLISEFTRALISHRDGELVYKYWNHNIKEGKDRFIDVWKAYSGLEKVHVFSHISRFLPMDIFIVDYLVENKINDTFQLTDVYQHINLVDAPLHDILKKGVSENHVHASATFTFSLLWQEIMNFNGDFNSSSIGKYINNLQISINSSSLQIKELLLTAQVIRIILAKYMGNVSSSESNILKWIKTEFRGANVNPIDICFGHSISSLDNLLSNLELLKKHWGINYNERFKDWFYIFNLDLINIKTYSENIFMYQLFQFKKNHIFSNISDKNLFLSLIFKYLRIKNEFYQQVCQTKFTPGLDYFRTYFARGTRAFSAKNDSYFIDMLRNVFQNQYLKQIELRFSILPKEQDNRLALLRIFKSYKKILEEDYKVKDVKDVNFPKIGIVFHLIKQRDNINKSWRLFSENNDKLTYLHYGAIQNKYIDETNYIVDLRNKIPYISNFIVGLDAASLENNTPVNVFSPVFSIARNSDREPLKILDAEGKIAEMQTLFFTFHAGEDFRHLLSGIRRIDEVIDSCKFHSGDRIGHGIALGIDVEKWVEKNKVTVLPTGEYLDNLLWVWGVYKKGNDYQFNAFSYLQNKIKELFKMVFLEEFHELTIEVMYEVYIMRFSNIKELFNKNLERDNNGDMQESEKRIWQFFKKFHEEYFLSRLAEPINIQISSVEAEIIEEMQQYVKLKVANEGIIIEINPSSNLVIGENDSIFENQFFSLNKVKDDILKNIMVNINSDDPIVFNTNISNEIAYLYYGMLYKGVGKEKALEWIDKIRETGMNTSFIQGRTSNSEYLYQLEQVIASLENPYYS